MLDRLEGQSLTMHRAGQQAAERFENTSRSAQSDGASVRMGRLQPHPIRSARQPGSVVVVPAFTVRSAQPGSRVQPPKRVNVFAERPTPSIAFRRIYQRGDLPVCIVHESRLYRLGWKVIHRFITLHSINRLFFCIDKTGDRKLRNQGMRKWVHQSKLRDRDELNGRAGVSRRANERCHVPRSLRRFANGPRSQLIFPLFETF